MQFMSRGVIAGRLVVSVLLLALVGGCGKSDTKEPVAAPSKTPKQIVLDAGQQSIKGSYSMTDSYDGMKSSGTFDPAAKKFHGVLEAPIPDADVTLHMEMLGIDPDIWVKTSFPNASADVLAQLPSIPASWMRVDKSKVTKDAADDMYKFEASDATDATVFLAQLITVEQASTGSFSGTLDATKATDQATIDDDTMKTLGESAKTLPFTATVDDKGRLTAFTLKVPGVTSPYEVTFNDFGTPMTEAAPADAVDAPEAEYELLNGDS
jgi:hypothetical protein